MVGSLTTAMEESKGPRIPCAKEQGKVFQQNIALMRDTLQEEVALHSADAVSRAALLSSVQRAELPRVEVLFSPFVSQRLAEVSAEILRGNGWQPGTTPLGDHGLQRGKLLSKSKARMNAYHVNYGVLNFVASILDAHLKACKLKEPDSVLVPLNMVQWFEQDARVLTMVW